MTDQELRALVRDAVAKHMGQKPEVQGREPRVQSLPSQVHPSHAIYLSVINTSDACVIEPGVACNHCNYCRSHSY